MSQCQTQRRSNALKGGKIRKPNAPAFPARVVDLLGAGDAFNGGFIAAQVAGHDLIESLRWGNAVAALKIAQPGARGLPSRAEVEKLLSAKLTCCREDMELYKVGVFTEYAGVK